MALPVALQRIVDWLRAGYPEGVPEHDYMPLFALLGTQLSAEEVAHAIEAVPGGNERAATVADAMTRVNTVPPSEEDVARVKAHLVAVGWTFEAPPAL
jgi:hypothetical protein